MEGRELNFFIFLENLGEEFVSLSFSLSKTEPPSELQATSFGTEELRFIGRLVKGGRRGCLSRRRTGTRFRPRKWEGLEAVGGRALGGKELPGLLLVGFLKVDLLVQVGLVNNGGLTDFKSLKFSSPMVSSSTNRKPLLFFASVRRLLLVFLGT